MAAMYRTSISCPIAVRSARIYFAVRTVLIFLYIIRHGDPDYTTDTLTERGRLQAEAVGKRIASAKVDRIFSSPMGRARQTAEPACRLLGIDYEVLDWTHEIGDERLVPHPNGSMRSITLLQNTYLRESGGQDLRYDEAFDHPIIAQSELKKAVEYIARNGNQFLERLGYKEENGVYRILHPNEERVALFCHGAFSRAWLSALLHIPVHMMWSDFAYTHTGVTVLQFKNNENGFTAPKCLCFSDMSHLYAEGLDMVYDNKISI